MVVPHERKTYVLGYDPFRDVYGQSVSIPRMTCICGSGRFKNALENILLPLVRLWLFPNIFLER